jgi:hypothetical protein
MAHVAPIVDPPLWPYSPKGRGEFRGELSGHPTPINL